MLYDITITDSEHVVAVVLGQLQAETVASELTRQHAPLQFEATPRPATAPLIHWVDASFVR
jgi:hypothetical protein